MAGYLEHIVAREVALQNLIGSHSIHLNVLQCKFLGSKLRVAVEQAKNLIEVRSRFLEDHTPLHLLRPFYWQVEGAVTLVEFFCEESWLSVAAVGAQAKESFTLACQELQWFTALFDNLCSQSQPTSDGIPELAGQNEIAETVAALAYQDGETLKLKLEDVRVHGSSDSERALAQTLLQRLKLVGKEPHPELWTLDASKLIPGKFIGNGATGNVYVTIWMNTRHAIKVFHPGLQEIFAKEVAILEGLYHPHVLPMIGSAVDLKGHCMLVVELMDEGLDAFIARRTLTSLLPLDEALDLMLQIGEGVKYLHQEGIVHRDMKLSNVLVKFLFEHDKLVRVKVSDFGMSKTKQRSSTFSPLTMNVGTSRWMAPEVLRSTYGEMESGSDPVKALAYPFKVDVYGFALICYSILTGREPYSDISSLKEIKRKVKDENLRPELPPSCPFGLAILLRKCWAANPETRPSFEDICNNLRHMKGLLLSGHSSITLKPVSEVLNPDIPTYNHILSVNAGRTYNKFTMLKNNKIVDLITHRELTSEEIYKRAKWRQLMASARSVRSPFFWAANPPTTQSHHVAVASDARALISSWRNKIEDKLRRPHAREFDFYNEYKPTEDEDWSMFISAVNQNFQEEEYVVHTKVAHSLVTSSQVKESLDTMDTFLEQHVNDHASVLLSALKMEFAQILDGNPPEENITGFQIFTKFHYW